MECPCLTGSLLVTSTERVLATDEVSTHSYSGLTLYTHTPDKHSVNMYYMPLFTFTKYIQLQVYSPHQLIHMT